MTSNIAAVNNKENTSESAIVYGLNGRKYKYTLGGWRGKVCIIEGCTNFSKGSTDFCVQHKGGKIEERQPKPQVIVQKEKVEETQEKKLQREKGKLCRAKGDSAELYVFDIIKANNDIEMVERIAQTQDLMDIIYKFKDQQCIRGIQVKLLSAWKDNNSVKRDDPAKDSGVEDNKVADNRTENNSKEDNTKKDDINNRSKDTYSSVCCDGYPPETLIVLVNENRDDLF